MNLREVQIYKQKQNYDDLILSVLKQTGFSLNVQALALLTGIDRTRISKRIKHLQKRGLIEQKCERKIVFYGLKWGLKQ